MVKAPVVSIVIPHRNSLVKLVRLLNSIPKSDFFQIVVVDDNSDEQQLPFALIEKFRQVDFFRNENNEHNAGSARNLGLEKTRGDWVVFADADDYFFSNELEKLPVIIDGLQGVDICFFKVDSIDESTGGRASRHEFYNKLVDDFLTEGLESRIRYKWSAPWGKLIRMSLIKNNCIRFDSIIASNDVNFSMKVGLMAGRLKAIESVIYCVTKSSQSLTAELTPDRALARLQALVDCNFMIMGMRIPTKMDRGYTYFIKSQPWRFEKERMKVYYEFFRMTIKRIVFYWSAP
jgi:glycosyltransferase involved in cell wall biosynthesis